jgi:dolichol-phosphate mannosyltransferase
VVVCLIGGAILISIGVLGEYVGRIFEESKGRPLYVVATTTVATAKREQYMSEQIVALVQQEQVEAR